MLNSDRILTNCIKASLQGTLSQSDFGELFAGSVEWGEFLKNAALSGTGPLLYYIMAAADLDVLLPEQTKSELRALYYSGSSLSILYYKELGDVLSSFQRSGIQVIILKGAALAEALYPYRALRPFGDIDLLIRDQDLPKAQKELECSGYVEDISREFYPGYRREFEKHYKYLKEGPIPLFVELHTSLLPFVCMKELEADGLWNRAIRRQIDENAALMLSLEDNVLHLCIHIFNHALSTRLLWLYDIALIISRHGRDMDWKGMEERAKKLGIYKVIGITLNHVKCALDLSMPQEADLWIRACRLSSIEGFFVLNGTGLAIWRYTLRLKLIKGVKNKLKLLFAQMFPSRSYIRYRYSVSKHGFMSFGYCRYLSNMVLKVLSTVFASFSVIRRPRQPK